MQLCVIANMFAPHLQSELYLLQLNLPSGVVGVRTFIRSRRRAVFQASSWNVDVSEPMSPKIVLGIPLLWREEQNFQV